LGLISTLEGDSKAAVVNFQKASELVTPYWQGVYQARIGEIYADEGKIDLAIEAYEEAVQIAEQFGDEESAEKYLKRMREIERNIE
jgi:tetratricopeptide (TPR) repeat protein